jgi:putative glycosyltransferase (TIGR04372 family)
MYRLIDKAIDYIGKKFPVLIHTPRADSLGLTAEDIFYGLLKAKRENKKIWFLYPHNLVHRKFVADKKAVQTRPYQPKDSRRGWWYRNLFSREFVANQQIFQVKSPLCIQNKIAWYLAGWLLTFEIGIFWLATRSPIRVLQKSLRLMRLIRPHPPARVVFDFAQMTPTIGRSNLWKPVGVDHFSWDIVAKQNWRQQYAEFVPPELLDNHHRRAERIRIQMGIPLDDWFVCLHVRESGYRNDTDNNRNATIHNYIDGINAITAAGGWVVRLGDRSMTPLPAMDRVIDYPHTRFKSELMDIYLVSQCRIYVGTNSGPCEVAVLFCKPTVLVNVTEWSLAYPVKMGDLEIIKHVFSSRQNRFLSIKEILAEPFGWQDFGPGSDGNVLIENTPNEIREVIEEVLTMQEDWIYSGLQESFNEGRRKQIYRWFDQPEQFGRASPEGSIFRMYRVAARCDAVLGTLGQRYLEQNWLVDNLKSSLTATG